MRAVVEEVEERLVADVMSSEPYSSFRSSKRLVGECRVDGHLFWSMGYCLYCWFIMFISLYSMHFAI